ncbi:hypothetical protein [Spirosoma endbachense]|uniref:DUF5683 domain-containing protein n=1 Tax=Spirosoma endbachense TaxID=2666025 RepID=A0A6P1VWK5_9BACT|nr:hypothetical protein [Spirosoma endbachense]QHV96069.1 hypothetical protein GJR95_14105 [Spirosoma endbachense]
MKPLYQLLFTLLMLLTSQLVQAQTSASNIRLRTDATVRKVIIEYELPQVLPDDSIYIELETASGLIIRPVSVNGDVGKALKPGKTKLIAWDVVRDNVRINEDVKVLLRVARMVTVASPATVAAAPPTVKTTTPVTEAPRPTSDRVAEPGSVVRKSSPLPLIGWIATAGLTGYATVLALGINKDVDEYNSKPFADDAADLQRFNDLKEKVNKNKSTFTIVAGAAAAVAIANVIYTFVAKPKPARTSLLIQSGNRITSVGLSRTF